MDMLSLFSNLTTKCKPIATKSRRLRNDDKRFVQSEIDKMLKGVIEESTSPLRTQVFIVTNKHYRKGLVVVYSQTINRFTHFDAYPLLRIDYLVYEISRFKNYSLLNLKSVYHPSKVKINHMLPLRLMANFICSAEFHLEP